MTTHSFTSAASVARMAKILAYLAEREPATVADIMAHIGIAENTVGGYLRHMAAQGQVYCVQRALTCRGGTLPATWTAKDAQEACEATDARRVVVSKVWAGPVPRMFEPMACLFGRAA